MINKTAVSVVAALSGLAYAEHTNVDQQELRDIQSETATVHTIDVSGIDFYDAQGSALNIFITFFLGTGVEVSGLGWDVNLTTIGASWASEATIGFEDQLFLAPGAGDDFSLSNTNYSSGGILDLTENGLDDIRISGDLILNIEFFDTFVDNAGSGDAVFEAGSVIYVEHIYPAPSTLALLGFTGLISARRRRTAL
ncbi:MAG: hypothetical protein P1U42_06805 [Phycisphaerales bacterium]|nr:hypothetical protein [Phycisphaerales bacterium]